MLCEAQALEAPQLGEVMQAVKVGDQSQALESRQASPERATNELGTQGHM